jgi:hypothetical protein
MLSTYTSLTARTAVTYPVLEASPSPASAGNFQLKWSAQDRPVLVQEASSADFADPGILYEGTDAASVVSGLPDGDYYFRIRFADVAGPTWSPPLKVVVAHHSLGKALGVFAVGAVVFTATIALIFTGTRRARQGVVDG